MEQQKLVLILLLLIYGCNSNIKKDESIEQWKNEILETEKEFAEMAQNEGISEAFLTYAADNAVLMRNNSLVIGKKTIQENFNDQSSDSKNVSLSWAPDFVDVASSGDLGYTYGKYVYTVTDSLGKSTVNEGVFHTVWKRQPDGTWKFVWD